MMIYHPKLYTLKCSHCCCCCCCCFIILLLLYFITGRNKTTGTIYHVNVSPSCDAKSLYSGWNWSSARTLHNNNNSTGTRAKRQCRDHWQATMWNVVRPVGVFISWAPLLLLLLLLQWRRCSAMRDRTTNQYRPQWLLYTVTSRRELYGNNRASLPFPRGCVVWSEYESRGHGL